MIFPLRRLAAMALVAGAALGATASMAQPDYGYYPDEPTTVPPVSVYAPRTVGRSAIGAPIQIVREQRVVYTGDLDLRTYWGNRALRHRIQAAARDACDDLDARYPVSADNDRDCYHDAVSGAYYQVGYEP
jgi:UrcA family protein